MRAQTISLSGRRKRKLERQIEKYLSALQTHRNDYKTHIELGDAYIELDDVRKGIKSYYGAIELLQKVPNVGKTHDVVIELYEKIIELVPEEHKAYTELSEEYIAAGQKEKAFRFLLTSAKKAYEEQKYELALQCYTQAIAKGRTNPHIVERCTELYLKLGRKEEAMQNYVQIGDMYAQEEKNIEALEYYKKACALEPENPELLLKVARMYNAMAWTENAASELVKVGEHYEHNHEYTEALRYYNYSVRLDPENERAQEGRHRINKSPSLEGLVITDDQTDHDLEAQIPAHQDDHIDEIIPKAEEADIAAEFDLTPLDATLTFENAQVDPVLSDEDESAMDMIVLDEALDSETPASVPPAADDIDNAEAFILDENQLADQENPSAIPDETLQFLADTLVKTAEQEPEEQALFPLQTDQEEEIQAGSQILEETNLFILDEEDEASEVAADADLFILDEHDQGETEAEIGSPPLFPGDENEEVPGDLFGTDSEEPELIDDLQAFANAELQTQPGDAETLFMHKPPGSDASEEPSPFDEDLSQPEIDANALPPAAEASADSGAAASSISLEDWIIDLKEDELVELALEEALREQEQEAVANWEELLGLESSQDDALAQTGSPLSLPSSSPNRQDLGTTGDIIDIETESAHPENAEVTPQTEMTNEEPESPEEPSDTSATLSQEIFPDETQEERVETFWSDEAPEQTLDVYLDQEGPPEPEESSLDTYFEEDQTSSEDSASGAEEEYADTESDESSDEIVLEIDTDRETLEELDSDNNEVETFLHNTEALEDQQSETMKAEVEEADLSVFQREDEQAGNAIGSPVADELFEEAVDLENLFGKSSFDDIPTEPEHAQAEEHPDAQETTRDISDLHRRIEDLEQQLERTEEEKYFLQERFAAQISQHKAHEESLQREIADVYRDKAELEKQLQSPAGTDTPAHAPSPAQKDAGLNVAGFTNDRYEMLIRKIEHKKTRIQKHLHTLLKKREEHGRLLNQDLNNLNTTKQRLQQNLEYIQQAKVRVEEKVAVELRQAREEVQTLTHTSKSLEAELDSQRQKEHKLRKEFAVLQREKEQLEEEYAETLSVFQQEKTELEQQLHTANKAKQQIERALKKKLQTLHRSYQQLKGEYKTVIELKDAQLSENAQRLRDVNAKYKKLETILSEIRKERDRLNTRLTQETAARESLEHKLVAIENQIDTLDTQEIKLMKQLGHELDRHFSLEQQVSQKFHLSLEEFEGILALQEQEIQALEAV